MKRVFKFSLRAAITVIFAAIALVSCREIFLTPGTEGEDLEILNLEEAGYMKMQETTSNYNYNFEGAEASMTGGAAVESPALRVLSVSKTFLTQAPQMLATPNAKGEWSMLVERSASYIELEGIPVSNDSTVTVSLPNQAGGQSSRLGLTLNEEGATEIRVLVISNTPAANEEMQYLNSDEGGIEGEPLFYPSRVYIIKIEKGLLAPVVSDQPNWSDISSGPGYSKKILLKDIDWDDFRLWVLTWMEGDRSMSSWWKVESGKHGCNVSLTWCVKEEQTNEPYIQFYYRKRNWYNETARKNQDNHQAMMLIYTQNRAYALVKFDAYPGENGQDIGWLPPDGGDWKRGYSFMSVDFYGTWTNLVFNDASTPGNQHDSTVMRNDIFEDMDPLLKPLFASRLAYIRDLRACYENPDSPGTVLDGRKWNTGLEKVVDGVPWKSSGGFIKHNVYALRVPAFAETVTLTPTSLTCYNKDLKEQREADYERFTVYNAELEANLHVRPYVSGSHETGFFYRNTIYDPGALYGAYNVKLAPGETKRVDFVVTSEDGQHTNTYYVYVTRREENKFETKGYSWAKRFNQSTVYLNYTDVETGEKVDTRPKPVASKPEYDGWKYYDMDDVMLVHKAKESLFRDDGKGINVVLMGDGFSQEQSTQGGLWETMALEAAKSFFDTAVLRDFKDHVNIWVMFNPCLGEGGVDGSSASKNRWGTSTPGGNVSFDSWSIKWHLKGLFGGENFDKNVIVAFKANGKFGSWSMGWICSGGYNNGYAAKHEFIGHTLANFADEYGGGISSEGISSKPMPEESNSAFKYPYDFDGICSNGIWNTTARDFRKHVAPPAGDTISAWAKTYAYANDPNRRYYYFDPDGNRYNNWTGRQYEGSHQDIDLNPDWAEKSGAWREWLKQMYLPPWKDFMDHREFITQRNYKMPPGYENDKVGIYEGGAGHSRGHYRSTPDSVMNSHSTYFTPWQRYILWAKVQYRSRAKNFSDFQMLKLENPFEGKFVKPAILKEFLLYDTTNTKRSKSEIEAWWNQHGKYLPDEAKLKMPEDTVKL
ncbi:MAG: hypothetical protein Pg6A_07370 [Termitinemataceae bacterium]|nr:MAG: hypothetical protein Pg6A_07370 [Termitinemataceae bacterium]